jgi:hypothetical protein
MNTHVINTSPPPPPWKPCLLVWAFSNIRTTKYKIPLYVTIVCCAAFKGINFLHLRYADNLFTIYKHSYNYYMYQ